MKSLKTFRVISLRLASAGLLAYGSLMPAVVSAAAQPTNGTLVGSVTCGAAATTPAANATVAVEGVNVATHTGSDGSFTLTGVPAVPDLTIDALTDSGAVVSSRYHVEVQAGQTLDIGSLDLAICPRPTTAAQDQSATDNSVEGGADR
jgi:hypothetical protein